MTKYKRVGGGSYDIYKKRIDWGALAGAIALIGLLIALAA